MKKMSLVLATGALLAGGAAIAQPFGERAERGPATRDTVIERTDAMFAKMDANGDGVLSEADREAKMAERFAQMDTDGDGVLSRTEFAAAHEAMRDKRAERREARAERRANNPGGERMGRHGGRHHGQGGPGGMIRAADANGDGQVTKAELQTAALARFDKADTDGDGTVTREERRAAMQAFRTEKRGQ
ncbi:EF-hand domain-containing protein [Parerythrobacter aestuarii]|uniref:EF-hand domain-containing protein n=1 Tax=Parerythrobacter aestuarii TaxID=3020909 RepID=UPI0024DE6958|nr:EF-hand domain-containing protein [Parerythrobacter aestuarii]